MNMLNDTQDPRIAAWNALEVKRRDLLDLRARACRLNLPGIRELIEERMARIARCQADVVLTKGNLQ